MEAALGRDFEVEQTESDRLTNRPTDWLPNWPAGPSHARQQMIPMRDGTLLHTRFLVPRGVDLETATNLTVVLDRSPYGQAGKFESHHREGGI